MKLSFSQMLAWLKIRWDQGGMIITFASYCLLIVSTSPQFLGFMGIKDSPFAGYLFIAAGVLVGMLAVVGFGHFLISIRYMQHYIEESNTRNPTLLEILDKVKRIDKRVK